jgi:uncharacterized repeat protein (TIGR01451 family)
VSAAFDTTSAGAPELRLSVSVDQPAFTTGQTLTATLTLENPGAAIVADFYLGVVLPDGETIAFLTSGGVVAFGRRSDPTSFRPVAAGAPVPTGFAMDAPLLLRYTWTGTEPTGTYVVFWLALQSGRRESDAILALGSAPFTFIR